MPITLKNQHVEEMAREVARLSGCTLTDAIGKALTDELCRLKQSRRGQRTANTLHEVALRCGALPDLDVRSPDVILGYDQDGGLAHGG